MGIKIGGDLKSSLGEAGLLAGNVRVHLLPAAVADHLKAPAPWAEHKDQTSVPLLKTDALPSAQCMSALRRDRRVGKGCAQEENTKEKLHRHGGFQLQH